MPQVAARITVNCEKKLQALFKTKSAGSEFVLPWFSDTFERTMKQVKEDLTQTELKFVVTSYERVSRLLPEQCKLSYFKLQMQEAWDEGDNFSVPGVSWPALQRKIDRLSDLQAGMLMVWAAGYWSSPQWKDVGIDEYCKP